MKLLYISNVFNDNIGANMHYNAIKEIVGPDNVFTIDLSPFEPFRNKQYIAYGKYRSPVDRICRWLQGNMMFIDNKIISEIIEIIRNEKIDIVFIEDSVFGNLVKKIKLRCPHVRTISFYHDIKAVLFPQWIRHAKFVNKIEYTVGIRQEKVNSKYCDINIVFNQRDADCFKRVYGRYPEAKIALPASVPVISPQYKEAFSERKQSKQLLFVGKNYYPNLLGFKWFAEQVLPGLSENIQVNVVGRGLEMLREEYTDPRIRVVGGVESLDPYYREADIVIAPLFDGGGMKSKTVEAMSFGKMFIGTRESLFGFWEEMDDSLKNKIVYQTDAPEEWISIINRLADSEIRKFSEAEFALFVRKFSYETARDRLAAFLKYEGGES